jgi:hypothetical protein
MANYGANCGGKRRGCCLIPNPTDSPNMWVIIDFSRLPTRQPPGRKMVFKPVTKDPAELG